MVGEHRPRCVIVYIDNALRYTDHCELMTVNGALNVLRDDAPPQAGDDLWAAAEHLREASRLFNRAAVIVTGYTTPDSDIPVPVVAR